MNETLIRSVIDKALARAMAFPEVLAALQKEGIESYHVDFLRNEFRYYGESGEYLVVNPGLVHGEVAGEFSADKLESINKRVQAGQAGFVDFVREGPAAGCAYYIVFLNGRKVRYFGRDGDEHVQYFPGSR